MTILLSTQLATELVNSGESNWSWQDRGKVLSEDGRVAAVTATAVREALVDWAEDAIVAGVL